MWRQPRTVWSVAFACFVAFMGIGLVDPILKPIGDKLGATPSQVSLLFTSYMAVMGLAMLVTGWVSSRLGSKRTLLLGLTIIIVGAGFAGAQGSIAGIVGFRALWGLGNALFIATALATIVRAARGSVAQAIILFEAAIGLGIATGPLMGGALGSVSWRWPFFGVSALMLVALVSTWVTLPATPPSGDPTPLSAPLKALRHRGLLTVGLTALLYNMGFFTLLAFTPFPLDMSEHAIGLVFFAWGLLLAIASVLVAPWVQRRVGMTRGMAGSLLGFAGILAVMGAWTQHKPVLVVGTILSGVLLGINNILITETVMKVAPVERGVAAAAYSFVRFGGGAVAPWLAGVLGERSVHLPFWVGAGSVVVAVGVLLTARTFLAAVDAAPDHGVEPVASETEAAALTTGT